MIEALALKHQLNALSLQIAAEAKVYDASWLPNSKKVYRDGGKFASPGGTSQATEEKQLGPFKKAIRDWADGDPTTAEALVNSTAATLKAVFTGPSDAEMKKADTDTKTALKIAAKAIRDRFNIFYRKTIEPALKKGGKDSIGAKLENLIDQSLRAIGALDKPMTEYLKDSLEESTDKINKVVPAVVGAAVCIAFSSAVFPPLGAVLMSAEVSTLLADTALVSVVQPFLGIFTDASLRFGGVTKKGDEMSKLIENAVSFGVSGFIAGVFSSYPILAALEFNSIAAGRADQASKELEIEQSTSLQKIKKAYQKATDAATKAGLAAIDKIEQLLKQ